MSLVGISTTQQLGRNLYFTSEWTVAQGGCGTALVFLLWLLGLPSLRSMTSWPYWPSLAWAWLHCLLRFRFSSGKVRALASRTAEVMRAVLIKYLWVGPLQCVSHPEQPETSTSDQNALYWTSGLRTRISVEWPNHWDVSSFSTLEQVFNYQRNKWMKSKNTVRDQAGSLPSPSHRYTWGWSESTATLLKWSRAQL